MEILRCGQGKHYYSSAYLFELLLAYNYEYRYPIITVPERNVTLFLRKIREMNFQFWIQNANSYQMNIHLAHWDI